MVEIKQDFVKIHPYHRDGVKLRKFRGVTVHETGNKSPNSDALAHRNFYHNLANNPDSKTYIGYHLFTDDKPIAYQVMPFDERAWTCGDGSTGIGNNETASIEMAINPECDQSQARENTAQAVAMVLHQHGFTEVIDGLVDTYNGNVYQHWSWSGKSCPFYIRKEGKWEWFIGRCQHYMEMLVKGIEETDPDPEPEPTGDIYRVQVGAFSVKENAERMAEELTGLGYQAFIKVEKYQIQ